MLSVLPAASAVADEYHSAWPSQAVRPWIGSEYWSNPLQDWRIAGGKLECIVSGANRNVHLLTHQLGPESGDLHMSVRLGRLDTDGTLDAGLVGFLLGVRGPLDDYRNNLLHGRGIPAGLTTTGELVIGLGQDRRSSPIAGGAAVLNDVELRLTADPQGNDYRVLLSAWDPATGSQIGQLEHRLPAGQLIGNLALLCHNDATGPDRESARGGNVRFWFTDWNIAGSKVVGHPDQVFGPILFAQYTLSGGVMKITAQMPPLGPNDAHIVKLQIRQNGSDAWTTVGQGHIDHLSRTATIRVDPWDDKRDTPYRLVYALADADGSVSDHYWTGTVRRDPVDREEIVVAGFTGNQDYAFPNHVLVQNVARHNPDLLFFSGDQIYESVAGYGIQRGPLEDATLDYLRKWYVFGWAFRGLLRDRPSIAIPDDHDVYQGNIWGNGGRPISLLEHDAGGYVMDPLWVNMVQRTQVDHFPDAWDPTPIKQDITVYYTNMTYGRVSFAILEDRKWKSGPKGLVPPTGSGRPDHVIDPNFDPATADVSGAVLLGERQLQFLNEWGADWRGADFKVALSQTIFAGSSSLHGGNKMRLVADYDCNGWPQTGRNNALAALRRAFALHIGGDQHLATIIHHGIDAWNDAGWSLCVPSIAAGYPRVWAPLESGKNRQPGMPEYTGEFLDGFGNRMTIWAVANPEEAYRPSIIPMARDRASGYGLVRFNRRTRDITLECWPLDVNPLDPGARQYPGWPKTINQRDNDGRNPVGYLPTLHVSGMRNPVVQVIEESSGQTVYTIRSKDASFRPQVYKEGKYTVRIGAPETDQIKTLTGLRSTPSAPSRIVEITF